MKKIILSLLFSTLVLTTLNSCENANGSQSKENQSNNVIEDGSNTAKPEMLTYEKFLKEVWDFETSPQEWKFKGEIPAVIDFYADWCGPCRMIAPYMEKFAKEYDGKVKIYKINVDKEKKLAEVFQVRSIPLVIFIPTQGQPSKEAGALNEAMYRQIIEERLLGKSAKSE